MFILVADKMGRLKTLLGAVSRRRGLTAGVGNEAFDKMRARPYDMMTDGAADGTADGTAWPLISGGLTKLWPCDSGIAKQRPDGTLRPAVHYIAIRRHIRA